MKGSISRKGGGVLVDLPPLALPAQIDFDGRRWEVKAEFHVTLVGSDTLQSLVSRHGVTSIVKLELALSRSVENLNFIAHPHDDFWLVTEDEAATIIQRCDLEGGDEFFSRLNRELADSIEIPPYHITLYCIGTTKGIGVPTYSALESMGRRLSVNERAAFLRALGR